MLAAKALVAELRFYLALRRFSRKYREDQPRDDHGRWVYDGGRRRDGSGRPIAMILAGPPRIPEKRPPTGPERTGIAKEVALGLGQMGLSAADVIAKSSWLYDAIPNLVSYLDASRSLEELRENALTPAAGYDVHHIVERASALEDGYGSRRLDAPENLVRIPRMRHWEINAWYQTRNENFGGVSPREYLRYKDWDERERVGLDALRRFQVLKP